MAEEEFEHTPKVWTVGDLRRALAPHPDIPDSMPLRFFVADTPGGDSGDTQIAYDAKVGQDWSPADRDLVQVFIVELEFKPGKYIRQVRD